MGAHGILPRQLSQLRGASVVPAQDAIHIERRIPMNLTDTQTQPVVLSTAAKREDGGVERRKHRNPTDFVVKQPGRVQPVKKSKAKKLQRSYKSRRAVSKQERVIEMLQRPQGTPIATIMKATGWQQHSVRGFFAAVVRKKLGLNLVSTKCDNERVYRIVPKETSRKSKSHNGT
jgi:hypothetical protein